MTLPTPIPIELAEIIAERLRVIGDPNRIRILDQLREGEVSVTELTRRLGTSQQNVSKHLGVLHGAGIVSRRKEGTSSLYSVADQGVFDRTHLRWFTPSSYRGMFEETGYNVERVSALSRPGPKSRVAQVLLCGRGKHLFITQIDLRATCR